MKVDREGAPVSNRIHSDHYSSAATSCKKTSDSADAAVGYFKTPVFMTSTKKRIW